MRIVTAIAASLFSLPLVFLACSSTKVEDNDSFATLEDCYTEHHVTESLSTHDAIVVCCIDHPIAGVHPSCENTQADCVTHVRAELDSSVTDADIQAACTDYITEK